MELDMLSRRLILSLAGNKWVTGAVSRYGMQLGAARFVAGETVDEALGVVHRLNEQGIKATLDHLGESVDSAAEAREAADAYLHLLDAIAASRAGSNVSLKLTQMGLAIDPDLCRDNMERIVARAKALGNFVRIDMEDSPYTDATLGLFRHLHAQYEGVGIVVQAYLYRSMRDLQDLAKMGANVRLVKGAYREPASVAYPRKKDVDENFQRLIAYYLEHGGYTAVATHDDAIIEYTLRHVEQHRIPRDRFEFQMLYGVRETTLKELGDAGYRVRVYVPYGRDWYPYFTRRLAERPANIAFLVRNFFRR